MQNIPHELRYTVTHEWVRNEGDGLFTVGLTDPAQNLLGTMINVDLPAEHDSLNAGEDCAVIESMKTSSDVFMPLSGDIVAVNDELENQPELINNAPYSEGWLFQIQINNANELDDLLDAESYLYLLENADDDYDYEENSDDE